MCLEILYIIVVPYIAAFNNISVILWRLVLLVEKTTDLSQVTDKLYHIILCIEYTSPWTGVKLTTS